MSCMTGTGFMKCMPMKSAGRLVMAASLVMEMELVLEARMAPGLQTLSKVSKICFLISQRSVAASMTMSQAPRSSRAVVVFTRPKIVAFSSAFIFPLSTPRWRFLSMVATPFAAKSAEMSCMRIENPLWAKTWAMPLPICPAPMTPTVLI